MQIKIQLIGDVKVPEKAPGGAWYDVSAGKDIEYKAGERVMIPLGFACRLPDGYEACLVARSSTYKKYGLLQANAFGVIDPAFCGPGDQWHFQCHAVRDGVVKAGERVAQFRIQAVQPDAEIVLGELDSPDRGGFGSTG